MYTNETTFFGVLIATLLIAVIVVVAFMLIIKNQYNRYLALHNRLEKATIEAQEAERKIIAADLHDDIGPILLGVRNKLEIVRSETEQGEVFLQEAKDHLREIYNRLKGMAIDLFPQSLSFSGAIYALEEFVTKFLDPLPIELDMNMVESKELGMERSIHLYRILKEILTNTIRHANATELKIQTVKKGNDLIIHTSDDGKGFEYNLFGTGTGLGLTSIRTRADLLKAELSIDSKPGRGTRFYIKVPIKPEQ